MSETVLDGEPMVVAAQRFYDEHRAEHLSRDCDLMVERCTDHLLTLFPVSRRFARVIAQQVLVEGHGAGLQAYIDIDRSTGSMVILKNTRDNVIHLITLPELFALVEARQRSAA